MSRLKIILFHMLLVGITIPSVGAMSDEEFRRDKIEHYRRCNYAQLHKKAKEKMSYEMSKILINIYISEGTSVDALNSAEETPLLNAAFYGNSNFVRALVEAGADVNKSEINHNLTPLIVAAYWPNVEMVKLLVEQGARVNDKTEQGSTALKVAVKRGNTEIVRYLVGNGADTTTTHSYWDSGDKKEDITLIEIATELGHDEIISILEEAATIPAEHPLAKQEEEASHT